MSDEKFDDGFSLVELLVSVFLIAILSVALIPNLVASMQAGSNMKTRTFAIAVNRQAIVGLEAAGNTSCSALNTYVATSANQSVVIPTGKTLTVTFSPASFACTANVPYSQPVTATVTDSSGFQLSRATTSIWITQ